MFGKPRTVHDAWLVCLAKFVPGPLGYMLDQFRLVIDRPGLNDSLPIVLRACIHKRVHSVPSASPIGIAGQWAESKGAYSTW